jgi:lysophospholipase L1-like esterase
MARRIATTRASRARLTGALVGALALGAFAQAQTSAQAQAPAFSKACQSGSAALSSETPLPNVSTALAQRKAVRILAFGAAPGRVGPRGGGYTGLIESMLQSALKGVEVTIVNRGVSGELAGNAAARMKNEVALEEPALVLWQVGTNDALAYVDAQDFAATLKEQIDWLKAHKVDVVLVGLQFAPQMQRDAHYVEIREALRRVAAQENVIVIRFFEAMQIIAQAQNAGPEPVTEEFERNEAGYNCLAQYVARAITLGVFAKNMPKREPPPAPQAAPPSEQAPPAEPAPQK